MRLTICLFIIISTIALGVPIDPVDGKEATGALRPNSLAIPNPIRVERPDDGNSSAANGSSKDTQGGARGGEEEIIYHRCVVVKYIGVLEFYISFFNGSAVSCWEAAYGGGRL
ncbi:hypothetical protein FOZ63_005591, partial [Perkinsus olseni]